MPFFSQERQEAASKQQQRHNDSSGSDLLGDGSGLGEDSSWGSGFPSPMGKIGESTIVTDTGGDDDYGEDSFVDDDNSVEDIETDEQLEFGDVSDEEYF